MQLNENQYFDCINDELYAFSVHDFAEFRMLCSKEKDLINKIEQLENTLLENKNDQYTFNGICWVCNEAVDLSVDYEYSFLRNGIFIPNLRERLICPHCLLYARVRSIYHFLCTKINPDTTSSIYITEQTTPLFRLLKRKFPYVIGSEFLGKPGKFIADNFPGIRNEDLCDLTFDRDAFDYILTFDCFEHIYDYKKALKECFRCLKKDGTLFFSIPFYPYQENNILRAYLDDDGNIVHILPEEWHGDPISTGSLCFHNFGWQFIYDTNAIGFESVEVIFYWSSRFGYLGGLRPLFIAMK